MCKLRPMGTAPRELNEIIQTIESAKLPDGYLWGEDAMEAFEFGKQRAIAAIKERYEKIKEY